MEFMVMNLLKRAGLHTSSQARNLSMGPFYTSFGETVNGWEWDTISQHWAEASSLDHPRPLIMNHALGCKCGFTYFSYGYLM